MAHFRPHFMTLAHFGHLLYNLKVVYTGTSHVSTSLIPKLGRSLGMMLLHTYITWFSG